MKKFLEENNVLATELPRLKKKILDPLRLFHLTESQWYNRHKGLTPLTLAERECMKRALDEVREELQQLIATRPLDERDK